LNFISKTINRLAQNKIKKKYYQPPVIIGGCGRSGTTLLLSILSAHKEITAFSRELGVFHHWQTNGNPEQSRLNRFYRAVLFTPAGPQANRWCEKTPRNILYIKRILQYFNNKVKIIHIIRDGRDVILSRHPSKKNKFHISPERWIRDVNAGLAWKDNEHLFTVKYEDLISSYTGIMKKICTFLEISFDGQLLNWLEYTTVKKNRAWSKSVTAVHTNSLKKWQKPEYQKRVKAAMQNREFSRLLKELGYLE